MGTGISKAGGGSVLVEKINSLEKVAMDSVKTPIKTTDFKEGAEVQDIWSKAKMTESKLKKLPEQTVNVADLYSWQRVVNKDALLGMVKSDTPHSSDMPVAVSHKGKLVLVDGNHRAAMAILKGQKKIQIRVYKEA